MEQEKKKSRGGKREGAGRPKMDDAKQPITVRLDADLYNVLKSENFKSRYNMAQFVNDSIRNKLMIHGFLNGK